MHIQAVKIRAKKLGATVHNNCTPKVWDYGIESPPGKVWNATGTHELILNQAKGNNGWLREGIIDVLDRMDEGISDCDDSECEWCHPFGIEPPAVKAP